MSNFVQTLAMMLTIFPTWLSAIILGFLTFLVILLVIKVVGFVLDAVPFL